MKHPFFALLLSVAVLLLFSAAQPVKTVLAATITIVTVDGTYIEVLPEYPEPTSTRPHVTYDLRLTTYDNLNKTLRNPLHYSVKPVRL